MNRTVSPPSILVIAEDSDLRQSLAFMLNAEGFQVEARDYWKRGDSIGKSQAMVLDHRSLAKESLNDDVLRKFGERLIVLAGTPSLPSVFSRATIVRKPLLEGELLDALHGALES